MNAKICKDCGHIAVVYYNNSKRADQDWCRCTHYSGPNPVTGEKTLNLCKDNRSNPFECGREAKWFKPLNPRIKT